MRRSLSSLRMSPLAILAVVTASLAVPRSHAAADSPNCYSETSKSTASDGTRHRQYSKQDGEQITITGPPSGFNPSKASDADLAKWLWPARPSDPAARDAWNKQWNHTYSSPDPTMCSSETSAAHTTSRNWAGFQSTIQTFTDVQGEATIPSTYNDCPHPSDLSSWAGLGGATGDNLAQAGWDSSINSFGVYYAFYEEYPYQNEVPLTNYQAVTGDFVYFHVTHGNGVENFHIVDNGPSAFWDTLTLTEKDNQTFSGHSAEVISERGNQPNHVPWDLRHFTTPVNWVLARAGAVNGSVKDFNLLSPLAVFMTNTGQQNGKLLAQPTSISVGGQFQVNFFACQ